MRWRGNGNETGRGPGIAVIGNCQAGGIADALRVQVPDARVSVVPIGRIGRRHRSVSAFAESLRGYDHVFLQAFGAGILRDGDARSLAERLPAARLFPPLVFSAFHPDVVYAGGGEAGLTPSPLHNYHSAIVLFGFLRGLAPRRIAGLFREDVFAQLGYLGLWQAAADDLLAAGDAAGLDLRADLLRWSRAGSFMHIINHPKLFVLADIAARLMRGTGIDAVPGQAESYLADALLDDVVWPIYPPVAEVYGLRGSYVFKGRQRMGETPAMLDLEGLIERSVAMYATMPRERLACHRTEHWAGSPEIRALFDAA